MKNQGGRNSQKKLGRREKNKEKIERKENYLSFPLFSLNVDVSTYAEIVVPVIIGKLPEGGVMGGAVASWLVRSSPD